jgi:hypothetical protein
LRVSGGGVCRLRGIRGECVLGGLRGKGRLAGPWRKGRLARPPEEWPVSGSREGGLAFGVPSVRSGTA